MGFHCKQSLLALAIVWFAGFQLRNSKNLHFGLPSQAETKAVVSTINVGNQQSQHISTISVGNQQLQIYQGHDSDMDGADKVCSLLKKNHQFSSLNSFWLKELDKIRDALLHSPASKPFGKRSGELQSLIDQVLDALPPRRLRRSLRPQSVSPEHHPLKIRRILNIIWERYKTTNTRVDNTTSTTGTNGNQTQAQTQSPKFKVLVFGGSPTAGSNCERNNRLKKQDGCAWPGHLETFINAYLGFDAVEVVNYAMGASSSSVASMMLQFRLFPASMLTDGPDIIINAYSVNDFSYYASGSFQKMVEDFIESANSLQRCDGDRPLVIYLDDFVVNYERGNSLMVGESYNAEIAKLMQWYQVMTVAYTDIVRDMVYADREEEKLLVDWKGDGKHLTWAGHIAVVLSFMFNAVNSVLDFCDDETYRRQHGNNNNSNSSINSINSINNNKINNKTTPLLYSSLRPVLSKQATLHSIADAWVERQMAGTAKLSSRHVPLPGWPCDERLKWGIYPKSPILFKRQMDGNTLPNGHLPTMGCMELPAMAPFYST
jgi:hypothetical protein